MNVDVVDRNSEVESGGYESNSECLSFALASEFYCIDILKVQEIRGYEAVTKIANTPDFIKGVVNLRGSIVPIVDLRIKFGLENVEYNDLTVVIILNLNESVVGIVVDSVSDVMQFKHEQIKSIPEILRTNVDEKFITGILTEEETMFIVVDIEALMNIPEVTQIDTSLQ